MTITVQIGNSDDKLPQCHWAEYINITHKAITDMAEEVHFSGTSFPNDPWQNAAWVFTIDNPATKQALRGELEFLCLAFHQIEIAWTEGVTDMIAYGRK